MKARALVDTTVQRLFLRRTAHETDDNLMFVRNRLLKSGEDVAALLDLYGQVYRGRQPVPDDRANPLCAALRLAGVARSHNGRLKVRNRIYEQVFDRAWVRANLPDAELRRQRAAFRRGVARTAGIAAVLLGVIGSLALFAVANARHAREAGERERRQRLRSDQLLYAADMQLAEQIWADPATCCCWMQGPVAREASSRRNRNRFRPCASAGMGES